jgi:hypothetical protein
MYQLTEVERQAGSHELRLRAGQEAAELGRNLAHASVTSDMGRTGVAREHSLSHHVVRTHPIPFRQVEVEGRLRHSVPVLVLRLESDGVRLHRFGVSEEAQVHNRARVDRGGDGAVRKGVPMDL